METILYRSYFLYLANIWHLILNICQMQRSILPFSFPEVHGGDGDWRSILILLLWVSSWTETAVGGGLSLSASDKLLSLLATLSLRIGLSGNPP